MKLIYEASNKTEAHVILDLLEKAGLKGSIDEFQTADKVRVMIQESDYLAAKAIIEAWDVNQAIEEEKPSKIAYAFLWGFVGLIIGLVSLTIFYNTPITHDGIDHNGDGTLDEKWTIVNNMYSKIEVDRNFDGQVDYISEFDRKGLIKHAKSDENFDGTFETESEFELGKVVLSKSDTTGDGFQNYHIFYKNGALYKIEFLDPTTRKVVKTQHYDGIRLISAELDSDKDGKVDTFYEYDEIEEVKEITNK